MSLASHGSVYILSTVDAAVENVKRTWASFRAQIPGLGPDTGVLAAGT